MTQNWKDIWNKRQLDPSRGSLLSQMMAANGYDTGFGDIDEQAWRDYVGHVGKVLNVSGVTSVFDVGCGTGAFLYPYFEQGCKVGGLDYSESLLKVASEVMPTLNTQQGEARNVDIEDQYDVVLSSGVFFYFPDLDYAQAVLERMVKKARRGIAILDIPDLAKKDEAMAIRKGEMSDEEYAKKYDGLNHLYFARDWFVDTLRQLGIEDVRVEDQNVARYSNSQYRFNVMGFLPQK